MTLRSCLLKNRDAKTCSVRAPHHTTIAKREQQHPNQAQNQKPALKSSHQAFSFARLPFGIFTRIQYSTQSPAGQSIDCTAYNDLQNQHISKVCRILLLLPIRFERRTGRTRAKLSLPYCPLHDQAAPFNSTSCLRVVPVCLASDSILRIFRHIIYLFLSSRPAQNRDIIRKIPFHYHISSHLQRSVDKRGLSQPSIQPISVLTLCLHILYTLTDHDRRRQS